MQFTPIEDFFSDEMRSQYCVGLSYNVTPENKRLSEMVTRWVAEGKVRYGVPDVPSSGRLAGSGKVEG